MVHLKGIFQGIANLGCLNIFMKSVLNDFLREISGSIHTDLYPMVDILVLQIKNINHKNNRRLHGLSWLNEFLKLGKFLESKHCILKALDYDEFNLCYLKQAAYIHIELGEYEEAETRFEVITHQNPQDAIAWFTRSEILIILGDHQLALNVLEKGRYSLLCLQGGVGHHIVRRHVALHACLDIAHLPPVGISTGTANKIAQ